MVTRKNLRNARGGGGLPAMGKHFMGGGCWFGNDLKDMY